AFRHRCTITPRLSLAVAIDFSPPTLPTKYRPVLHVTYRCVCAAVVEVTYGCSTVCHCPQCGHFSSSPVRRPGSVTLMRVSARQANVPLLGGPRKSRC